MDIENLASAWKGHRTFAGWLINRVQPKIVVDLGVDYGYSLFSFSEHNIGTVYGIDSFEGDEHAGHHGDAYDTVIRVIEENQYKNIDVIKGYFDDVVKTWDKPIDILHIDGLHTYEAAMNDYQKWSPFLTEDGVILMHDVVSFEGVRKVYEEIPMHKMFFTHSAGLGVLSKSESLINEVRNLNVRSYNV